MIPQHLSSRQIYVCSVKKALKDNSVVKKGESYIWVKRNRHAPKEYFKNETELNKVYPLIYTLSEPLLEEVLKEYKNRLKDNPRISPKRFIHDITP